MLSCVINGQNRKQVSRQTEIKDGTTFCRNVGNSVPTDMA